MPRVFLRDWYSCRCFFFFSFNLYFVVINLSLSIWRRETKNQVSNEEKKKHSHTHVWKKERVGLKLHGRYWCRRKVLNFSSKTSRGKGHLCHFQGNEWNYHFTLSLLVFPSNLRSHFSLTLPPLPPPSQTQKVSDQTVNILPRGRQDYLLLFRQLIKSN
jgi:hypothetical protein